MNEDSHPPDEQQQEQQTPERLQEEEQMRGSLEPDAATPGADESSGTDGTE